MRNNRRSQKIDQKVAMCNIVNLSVRLLFGWKRTRGTNDPSVPKMQKKVRTGKDKSIKPKSRQSKPKASRRFKQVSFDNRYGELLRFKGKFGHCNASPKSSRKRVFIT